MNRTPPEYKAITLPPKHDSQLSSMDRIFKTVRSNGDDSPEVLKPYSAGS